MPLYKTIISYCQLNICYKLLIAEIFILFSLAKELLNEVPSKWERHGDLVIIPAHTFSSPEWAAIGKKISDFLNCFS